MSERLESLKVRHAGLEAEIAEEAKRPNPDDDVIHSLKKEKLKVKDEIARLERGTTH
ncbi:MAG: YdcH family protein [Rhodospirillaceae bacterium]|nr:YdcH family protein [Rhodospirillaceae bacterium]